MHFFIKLKLKMENSNNLIQEALIIKKFEEFL